MIKEGYGEQNSLRSQNREAVLGYPLRQSDCKDHPLNPEDLLKAKCSSLREPARTTWSIGLLARRLGLELNFSEANSRVQEASLELSLLFNSFPKRVSPLPLSSRL